MFPILAQLSDAVTTGGAVAVAIGAIELAKRLIDRRGGGNNKTSWTWADRTALQDVHKVCSKTTPDGRPRCYLPDGFDKAMSEELDLLKRIADGIERMNGAK